MKTNALPQFDDSVNTTGCCPKFNPDGWDGQVLHFRDKPFLRAETRSLAHVPLNMGKVFARVNAHMAAADAVEPGQFIALSHEVSPWSAEHLFAVTHPVPDEEMTTLSGDFVTKVFEGPFSDARHWSAELADLSARNGAAGGRQFFFYTTCPKCGKAYGQNYVIGLAEVAATSQIAA